MMTMNIEDKKAHIINWITRIHDEQIIHKLDNFRFEELDLKNELTEAQKQDILQAINLLEED